MDIDFRYSSSSLERERREKTGSIPMDKDGSVFPGKFHGGDFFLFADSPCDANKRLNIDTDRSPSRERERERGGVGWKTFFFIFFLFVVLITTKGGRAAVPSLKYPVQTKGRLQSTLSIFPSFVFLD